jgi:hypothetical protein
VPNTPVDMNSWGVSACYPRRTFYSLSDGPSIQNHRITKTNFRSCSTCPSRSQAPFCFCAHNMISDHVEGTFALLRYALGGDRPSQTTHHTLSLATIQQPSLEFRSFQGGISRSTPPALASWLLRLPPILHRNYQNPM